MHPSRQNDKSEVKADHHPLCRLYLYVIVVFRISSSREKQAADELSSLYDSYSYSYNIDD